MFTEHSVLFTFMYDKWKKMKMGLYACSDRLIWAEITLQYFTCIAL